MNEIVAWAAAPAAAHDSGHDQEADNSIEVTGVEAGSQRAQQGADAGD
jgi:hypothetical protein